MTLTWPLPHACMTHGAQYIALLHTQTKFHSVHRGVKSLLSSSFYKLLGLQMLNWGLFHYMTRCLIIRLLIKTLLNPLNSNNSIDSKPWDLYVVFWSVWNFTGASSGVLRHLSNFKVMQSFKLPIWCLWNFSISCDKISQFLKWLWCWLCNGTTFGWDSAWNNPSRNTHIFFVFIYRFYELVQDCNIFSMLSMEILQSCTSHQINQH